MTKQELKKAERRFTAIYGKRCHGIQIPIMAMGKVMKIGLDAISEGLDDAGVGDKVVAYVETIRTN